MFIKLQDLGRFPDSFYRCLEQCPFVQTLKGVKGRAQLFRHICSIDIYLSPYINIQMYMHIYLYRHTDIHTYGESNFYAVNI